MNPSHITYTYPHSLPPPSHRVSDGKSRPEPHRIILSMELITLQKLEDSSVSPTNNNLTSSATATSLRNSLSSNSNSLNNNSNGAGAPETKERMVQVTRQKIGGLGLSIKGGAEHKLPILISRFVGVYFCFCLPLQWTVGDEFGKAFIILFFRSAESTRTKRRMRRDICLSATQ